MNEEDAKQFVKEIEELIETVTKLSETDSLKAYVYLQHTLSTSGAAVVGALPMVWTKRENHQKEIEKVTRGHDKLIRTLHKTFEKLRREKIEELYKEFFPT